jgi:hypothetical protein
MAASVHFKMAELVEQKESVQRVDRAVLGMQVVGMVQASRDLGSQHPWTPLRVFVAQMKDVFGHVIEDSVVSVRNEAVLGMWKVRT